MIEEFKDKRPRVFFPTKWANSVARWIQGLHSESGTIKTDNTLDPKEKAASIDVDIDAVVAKSKPLLLKFFVGRADKTAIDNESIIVKDGKFAVSETWLDGRGKGKQDDDGTQSNNEGSDDGTQSGGDSGGESGGSTDGETTANYPWKIKSTENGMAIFLPSNSLNINGTARTLTTPLSAISSLGADWYALPPSSSGSWWLRLTLADGGITTAIVGTNSETGEGDTMVLIAGQDNGKIKQMILGTLFVATGTAAGASGAQDEVEPIIGNMPHPLAVRRTWIWSDALNRRCYEYWIMVFPRSDLDLTSDDRMYFRYKGINYLVLCRRTSSGFIPLVLPTARLYAGEMLTLNPLSTFQFKTADGKIETNAGRVFPTSLKDFHWAYLGGDTQLGDCSIYAVFVDYSPGGSYGDTGHGVFFATKQYTAQEVRQLGQAKATATNSIWPDFSTVSSVTNVKVAEILNKEITQVYEYEREEWAVEFRDWDNTLISRQLVLDGDAAIAPESPSRGSGYTFSGWSVPYNRILENTIIMAQYETDKTVTFEDWDGTVLKTEVVAWGGSATPPANPTRSDYDFTGWSAGYNNITADVTITAQYNIMDPITIYFVGDSRTTTRQIPRGSAVGNLPEATKERHSFTGWYTSHDGGTQITSESTFSGDSWLYARFTLTHYKVYFTGLYTSKQIASVSISETTVAIGSAVTFPQVAIHDSRYRFYGWQDDQTEAIYQTQTVVPTRDNATYNVIVEDTLAH